MERHLKYSLPSESASPQPSFSLSLEGCRLLLAWPGNPGVVVGPPLSPMPCPASAAHPDCQAVLGTLLSGSAHVSLPPRPPLWSSPHHLLPGLLVSCRSPVFRPQPLLSVCSPQSSRSRHSAVQNCCPCPSGSVWSSHSDVPGSPTPS